MISSVPYQIVTSFSSGGIVINGKCDVILLQVNFPMCTIAHTPRLPEHCIEYVKAVQWPNEKPFDGHTYSFIFKMNLFVNWFSNS